MSKNKRLAIIPARIGSKRIKKKNIVNFLGKPLIWYAIDQVKKSKIYDKIHISTDSQEIKKLSERSGIKVEFLREKRLADDKTTIDQVVKYVLKKFKNLGQNYNEISLIYATNPFIKKNFLIKGYKKYMKSKKKFSILSVNEIDYCIERSLKIEKKLLKFQYPQYANKRSNLFKKKYIDAGMFVIYQKDYFNKNSKKKFLPYILKSFDSVDINTHDDLAKAKKLFKR